MGLNQRLHNLRKTEDQKTELLNEVATLKTQVDEERKSGMIEVNNRERDKIEAVKKI